MNLVELTPKQIGAYRVEEIIDQGRNTLVLRAIDMIYQRPVALKVLTPYGMGAGQPLGTQPDAPNLALVRDFVSRGREAARLRHPHIAQVYEAGQADGYHYVAMELAEQGTLANRLAHHAGALSAEDALELITPIAGALAYAHAQGFIHGHLNPHNILLTSDDRLLVTNFQLKEALTVDDARHLTEEARNQQLAYLSPEQARGQTTIDERCDQFALGVLAYRLSTGRLPFAGANPLALLRTIIEEKPAPPIALNPTLPEHLSDAIMRALAKMPERRFGSTAFFSQATRGEMPPTPDLAGNPDEPIAADDPMGSQSGAIPSLVGVPLSGARKSKAAFPIPKPSAPAQMRAHIGRQWAASSERRLLLGVGALLTVALITLLLATLVRYALGTFTQPGVVEVQPERKATPFSLVVADATVPVMLVSDTPTNESKPNEFASDEEAEAAFLPIALARYEDPAQRFFISLPPDWVASERGEITQFNPVDQSAVQLFVEPLLTQMSTTGASANAEALMERYLREKILVDDALWQNVRLVSEAQRQMGNLSAYEQRFDATFLGAPVRFQLIALQNEASAFMLGGSVALAEDATLSPLVDRILNSFEAGNVPSLKVAQLPTEGPTSSPTPSPTFLPSPTLAPTPTNTPTPEDSPTPVATATPVSTSTATTAPAVAPPASETSVLLALAGEGTGLSAAENDEQAANRPLSGLSGHIAYAIWNHDSNQMDTYIYSIESGVSWPQLPNMRQPDFRFDGELIVNAEGGELNNLTRLRVSSRNELMISEHPEDSRPHWSPSGKQVIFDSTFVGDRRARIYLLDDATLRQEVGPVMFEAWELFGRHPIFLSNGRIAYNGCNVWENGGSCGIYATAMQNSPPDAVTSSPEDIPTDNLGAQILFMSPRERAGGADNWDVYLINGDGSNLRRLTSDPAHDGLATASPDGNYVAFASDRNGAWAIYVMRADGSGQQKLFDLNANYGPGEQYWNYDWKQERLSWGW